MSCILRIGGENFDVDRFLTECPFEPVKVWRKGEPRFKKSSPDGPYNSTSGVNIEVSPADFSELEAQISDAMQFFSEHQNFLKQLSSISGVEYPVVDFGVEIHPPGWNSFVVPPALLSLLGDFGISLMLSTYPVSDENET